jgi:peroxiredoxin
MKYLVCSVFFLALGVSTAIAQVPESAEDISPLLISEQIPPTNLIAVNGDEVALHDLLKNQKSILLFYRGGWCPYCNAHLTAVGQVEKEIIDLGYQIIAVCPDSSTELSKTIEKEELAYTILSDASGEFMKGVGIAFEAPERYGPRLSKYSDGLNQGLLPVPSLFVLDTEGIILFEYISPDYKNRISTELLLGILKNLE